MGNTFRINMCTKWKEGRLGRETFRAPMQSHNGLSQLHRYSKAGLPLLSCPELEQRAEFESFMG